MVYSAETQEYNGTIMLSIDILAQLEEQSDFPQKDLSDTNAEFLSLMLANAQILRGGHSNAEKDYPIFIGTHRPLVIAAENILSDTDKTRAVDFGIKAFEAITLFVSARHPQASLSALEHNINGIIRPANVSNVREYFEEANDSFRGDMPRTAHVIRETSERFVGSAALAILGGAIARQFELDNIED